MSLKCSREKMEKKVEDFLAQKNDHSMEDDSDQDSDCTEDESEMLPGEEQETLNLFPETEPSSSRSFGAKTVPKSSGASKSSHETKHQSSTDEESIINPSEWSIPDVCKWVKDNFDDEVANKFKEEEITGEMLVNSTRLTQENSMGRLGLTTLGKQENFSKLISKLRGNVTKEEPQTKTLLHEDRLLMNSERKHLTCEQKRTYNTKRKAVVKEIKREWPEKNETPNFRKNNVDEISKLESFVEKIASMDKYIYPECAFGPEAIKELVMSHMRERRRKNNLAQLYSSSASTSSDNANTDLDSSIETDNHESSQITDSQQSSASSSQKVKNYKDVFHPDLSQESCNTMMMVVLQKSSIKDIQVHRHLVPLKRLFRLSCLRAQEKNTYVRALANAVLKHGYIQLDKEADPKNIKRGDISVVKPLPDL